MPAVTGRTTHTVGGQNITTTRRHGTKVSVPPGVPASKPAGGSVVRTSGRPGAGVVQTIRSTPSGTVVGAVHAPSAGLSRAQVRRQDAKARAVQQAEHRRAALVTQAQHNLAKLAKPKIIHQLKAAGTISSAAELKRLKAAAPHVVLHYGNTFNPDVVHNVLKNIAPSLPHLPQNQKPKTSGTQRQGLRRAPTGSKVPPKLARKVIQGKVTPQQARKALAKAKLAPGGKAPKKKARVLRAPVGLSKPQTIFAAIVAKKTGLDPRVVGAWEQGEGPAGDKVFAATQNQNWLALGYPGHQTSLSQDPVFNNPVSAAKATAASITKGKYGTPPSIQALADLKGKSPAQQIAAISNSGWVSGTPGTNDYGGGSFLTSNIQSGTQKIKLKKGVASAAGAKPAKITEKGPLIHPFPKASIGRTDMGVDYTGSGPIRAMGNGKVVNVNSMGWPNGGAGPAGNNVAYTLTDGPLKGKSIYVAEGITPDSRLKVGSKLTKGQVVGRFYPGSSIETGFYDPASGNATAASHYSEGQVTAEGTAMRNLLTGKTVHLGTAKGGSFTGASTSTGVSAPVSTGASTAPAAASSASTSTTGRQARAQRRGLTPRQRAAQQAAALAARRRRGVLQGAITALGKAPAKAPKVALTSSAYSTAAKSKAIDLGLA